jgi:nucleoside-diphosphate-sugar epimerase
MARLESGRLRGRRIAVTGATGNVGTALLRRLAAPEAGVAEVRGLARRQPPDLAPYDGVTWHLADLGEAASEPALGPFLDGVDAVVHLAWALQPGRRPDDLREVNVEGTRRIARAAIAAGVRQFVHMSSLGAYAPAPVGLAVAEDWPVTGIASAQYSRDKCEAEKVARELIGRHPEITLTIPRPSLILQPEAGSEVGRYFLGPLLFAAARALPAPVARVLPLPVPDVYVGFVHSDDVADALVRMLDRQAPGPFNLSAEPILDAPAIARALGSRRIRVPAAVLRAAVQVAFTAHLIPTEPGWLDMAVGSPALDATRARTLLDWTPAHRGDDVLAAFVAALGRGEGAPGPLLEPAGGREHDPAGDPANTPSPGTAG